MSATKNQAWVIKSNGGLYLTDNGDWSNQRGIAAEYDTFDRCHANAIQISRDAETEEDVCQAVYE